MLSSRLSPANTPRQRLSMARDATLRERLGVRGQGRSCTDYFPVPLHCRDQRWGRVWGGEQSPYNKRMGRKWRHSVSTLSFGDYWV